MAARLKTGHKLPQMPNDALPTTGKPMWYMAPIRPEATTKHAAKKYPIQTHIQACHQDSPPTIMLPGLKHQHCAPGDVVHLVSVDYRPERVNGKG
jgi:hypothetical protein